MKSFRLMFFGLLLFMGIFSCKTDKQARLAELKQKHEKISEQIRQLESELSSQNSTLQDAATGLKVAIKELKSTTFDHYLEVQGKLDGEENIAVSAQTMGIITRIFVKMGDRVSKDQVLAQMDDAILQQNLQTMKSNLEFVTEIYEKQKRLWEQKIGSEVQYLTAKNNKESLENNIKSLEDQIDLTRIKSPINGTVEDVAVRIGQSAAPGFPLFRIVNFSTIKVVAEIAESYSSRVNPGDEVYVYFPDLQKEIISKISSVSKYIGPQNRTFQAEVRLKPGNDEFKANMIAILKINDYRSENTHVIPINIIQNDQEGSYVFLAEKSNPNVLARKVRIKTGQNYNGLIEITEGVKDGDLLITAGYLDLHDGQSIRF